MTNSWEKNSLADLKRFLSDYEKYKEESSYFHAVNEGVEFEMWGYRVPVPKPFRFLFNKKHLITPNQNMCNYIVLDNEDLEYLYKKYKTKYEEMNIGAKRREVESLRKEIRDKEKKLVETKQFLKENDPYEKNK